MRNCLLFWSKELEELLGSSSSIALGWFSFSGKIYETNEFMNKLIGERGTSAFLNPEFSTFAGSKEPDGLIFEGYITFKSSSQLNSSLLAKVYKKETHILVAGAVDVELMISQNAMLFSLHQEVTDLQKKLIDEKVALQNALKKLESTNEELVSLNNTKDKFFSIIAHDLRSPFQGFLGLTEILADKESNFSQEEFRLYSETLFETAQGLYSLLENLLKWSQIQKNILQIDKKRFDAAEAVRYVLLQLNQVAQVKGISLTVQVQEGILLYADENMIQTIIRNLISNAIKFSWRNGKISVNSIIENGKCVISVSDNGVGISPEDQQKLFRIDTKFNSKGTEGEASTGLGLLLCREFAEKNEGKLYLTSEEGKGSTFSLILPVAPD
ncbi:MAG: HAMP domain-containing histidine kinase [Ignavibacteriaceae bacterium]|nr:HAMP domain-containing histidine kinase [Ignavibacteriaceae bacterium]